MNVNMKSAEIITSIKLFIGFSILLGLVYPLAITGIAQAAMNKQANGSLVELDGKIVGSSLIGQKFDKPEYFASRPSAVNYDAAGSGASNFGPINKKYIDQVGERVVMIDSPSIPADMVLASASGLDPHISLKNANLQVPRVAKNRNLSEAKVKELVRENTDPNFIGLWGQKGVNVLKLNIALNTEANKGN